MIKDKITKILEKALKEIGVENANIDVDHPTNSQYGDYATSIALKLTKQLKKNPYDIVQEIVKNLPKDQAIEKVEIIKPGFINFWLSNQYLVDNIQEFIKKDFIRLNNLKDKKVMIEYTDPNLFKEFHIGHLYSNIIGESLVRLFEAAGAEVKRVNYQGDVGMHVAKAMWGLMKQIKDEKLTIEDLEKYPTAKIAKFMGKAYALGTRAYEENKKTIKKEIIDLNKKIYSLDPSVEKLYKVGRQWSLDYFETIYKRLGTKFDYYFFEREVGPIGLKYIKENLKKGLFEESKGAIVFNAEKYGLHTRVFINSLGLPTYEAKDLGLPSAKYKKYPYDLSIIVAGNEIKEYFKVVLKALEIINPELRKKTFHVAHGMVRLPEGKMSSRTGNIITAEGLLDETKKRVLELISKSDKLAKDKINNVSEKVAIGAVKYSLLKTDVGKDVVFNLNESLSLEGNSGPYLQYTYARCQSVLGKIKQPTSKFQLNFQPMKAEESNLLRTLNQFPEVIIKATHSYSTLGLCSYLFDLAQKFNLFYQKHQILKAEPEVRDFRLLLTKATGQIIKNGLYLLGIETVEKM